MRISDWSSDVCSSDLFQEALADANIGVSQIGAAWLGVAFDAVNVGPSAVPLAMGLRLPDIPANQIENLCDSGSEAFRGAVHAVASGAVDIALAVGLQQLKDTGYGGLSVATRGS